MHPQSDESTDRKRYGRNPDRHLLGNVVYKWWWKIPHSIFNPNKRTPTLGWASRPPSSRYISCMPQNSWQHPNWRRQWNAVSDWRWSALGFLQVNHTSKEGSAQGSMLVGQQHNCRELNSNLDGPWHRACWQTSAPSLAWRCWNKEGSCLGAV